MYVVVGVYGVGECFGLVLGRETNYTTSILYNMVMCIYCVHTYDNILYRYILYNDVSLIDCINVQGKLAATTRPISIRVTSRKHSSEPAECRRV